MWSRRGTGTRWGEHSVRAAEAQGTARSESSPHQVWKVKQELHYFLNRSKQFRGGTWAPDLGGAAFSRAQAMERGRKKRQLGQLGTTLSRWAAPTGRWMGNGWESVCIPGGRASLPRIAWRWQTAENVHVLPSSPIVARLKAAPPGVARWLLRRSGVASGGVASCHFSLVTPGGRRRCGRRWCRS